MTQKQTVVVMYGGKSAEHEISCRSAAFIFKNLDPARYDVHALGVDKQGRWWPQNMEKVRGAEIAPLAANGAPATAGWLRRILPEIGKGGEAVQDLVVFPIIHGTNGEDGALQGLFDLNDVAYVGADTLASAVGMNKLVAKRLAEAEGIPVVPYVACRLGEWQSRGASVAERVGKELGYPVFVKPVSLGSSVGISKVKDPSALKAAVDAAFEVDEQVLIEKGMDVREIEYGALGAYDPEISAAGEVVPPDSDFYSYDAKYSSASTAQVVVPAAIPADKMREGQDLSRRIFRALQLYGMARVDLFLTKADSKFYFNEVNTIPGFTSISQYPLLWKHAGISSGELLNRLIDLALQRQKMRASLKRTR